MRKQFAGSRIDMDALEPRMGRFYPKGVLSDVSGIFRANRNPFRCVDIKNGQLGIAMAHPMAGRFMDINATVGSIRSTLEERGGTVYNWGEIITEGVGMQARWKDQPTDFFSDQPFLRNNEQPDTQFYNQPRLVQHLDNTAIDLVRQLYGRFITAQSKVLDLMSSWQSHLPEDVSPKHVTGLGLNDIELQRNEALHDYLVHDLNADSRLPFDDHSFDIVICTVSVEYLTSPFDIFDEVSRVLQQGGYFVISFSNRWFEPKAIRIWTQMNEFERMGLVLEYFRHKNHFNNLRTYSIRGLPRPYHDKYYGQLAYADPVYAVWGKKQ
jgi:SAM-dependent methyltransferase